MVPPQEKQAASISQTTSSKLQSKFLATAIEMLEASFPHQPTLKGWKRDHRHGRLRISGPKYLWSRGSMLRNASWENQRLLSPIQCPAHKKEAVTVPSPLAPKQGLWHCVQEERHSIKAENSKVLPKELTIWNSIGKFKPQSATQIMAILVINN